MVPMTDADRVSAALERLPIFPLPGVVLLPNTIVPLHIFEPRYCKMTRDCQSGARVLALANIAGDAASDESPPRVLPIVGVGLLARVDPLPDGRFNIMVRGVLRARIVEELRSGEPYRLVRAEVMAEEPVLPGSAAHLQADELRRLVFALCSARPGDGSNQLAQLVARAKEPGELADIVAGSLLEGANERQAVLEAPLLSRRLDLAAQRVASLLAQSASIGSRPN